MREAKSFTSTPSTNKSSQESVNKVKFHSKKPQKKQYTRKSQPSKQAPATKVCYRCGSSEQMANNLYFPARNKRCNKCGTIGHFSKVCGLPRNQGKVRYTQMSSEPPSEYVQQPEGSVVRVLAAYNINRIEPDILCSLDINGVTVPNLVVDTGSDASLMDIHTFDKHFLHAALMPCQDSLSSYTHTKIKVIGCFPLHCLTNLKPAKVYSILLTQVYP